MIDWKRLLKAVGIGLLGFGAFLLLVFGFIKYEKITTIMMLVAIFIYVVWMIYTYGQHE